MVALEQLAAQTQGRCGIECKIESPEPVRVDDNSAGHASLPDRAGGDQQRGEALPSARRIVVRSQSNNGTLSVTVEDDGVGIAEQAGRNGGMGLRIMQYRAGVIDAALDVRPSASGGTAVVCLVKNSRNGTES